MIKRRTKMTTEKKLREKVVSTAQSYLGAKQGSAKHKKIIDTFNTVKPEGCTMTYTAYWCAAFASADAILALGADYAKKYFPLSCNCEHIITIAKKLKIWKESDAYVPDPGDWILYDWEDNGKGDNKGGPNHVGIVETASKKEILVIEGNKNKAVGERKVPVNGRYIRGFVVPDYAKIAEVKNAVAKEKKKPTGKQMVDLARKQLGNGYKKYCKAFGKATSWCQIFIWWLFDTKGMTYIKNSFARKAARWAHKHWTRVPMKDAKAGDVVFFTSKKGKGGDKAGDWHDVTHVGMIRKQSAMIDDKKNKGKKVLVCYTIEGNVKGKEKSQQGSWKNHIVANRTRRKSYVWAVFRPPYKTK